MEIELVMKIIKKSKLSQIVENSLWRAYGMSSLNPAPKIEKKFNAIMNELEVQLRQEKN